MTAQNQSGNRGVPVRAASTSSASSNGVSHTSHCQIIDQDSSLVARNPAPDSSPSMCGNIGVGTIRG